MPARTFMSVDLPAPFSPTSAWTSPARRSNRAPSSAWTPGNVLLIPSISTSRSPAAGCVVMLASPLHLLGLTDWTTTGLGCARCWREVGPSATASMPHRYHAPPVNPAESWGSPLSLGRLSASEMGEDREHAAMIVGRRYQLELREDAGDVGLDRLGGQEEALADRLVRAALGDEGEDLALPLGQVVERDAGATPADELGDHLGVDDRPASRDSTDGVGEVLEILDAVLQEIS